MKMDVKNMLKDFTALGQAKQKASLYVRTVTILCAVIIAIVCMFMNNAISNVTDKILVVNTGGELLKLKSMETDKLYKSLLESHCASVAYYTNSFDRLSITNNQAKAFFLVERGDLNVIFDKYIKDRAYADAQQRGIIYKCEFSKLQRLEVNGEEYNVIFTSVLSITDKNITKKILITSRGTAIRMTPSFPENTTGFFFKTYQQDYEIMPEN